MTDASQLYRGAKFGVDPTGLPAPPYPGFEKKEDFELQNLRSSQYGADHHGSSPPEQYNTYTPPLPIIPEESQQEHVPPKEDLTGTGATGQYLTKRNSLVLAVVVTFLGLGLISGWVTAIVFAKKLSHMPAVHNVTVTVTRLHTLPTSTIASVSTLPAANQTATQTSVITAIPTSLSNSTVWGCRQLLDQICRNVESVPLVVSGDGSGQFGDCEPVFRYFYCEYLFDLSNTPAAVGAQPKEVNGSWPTVESLECVGLRPYCVNYGESTGFQGKPHS